ncbi:DUF4352 domain-containing protein [Lactococcus hircilactis]|uniref:DUF4352 domain-containing protein n=1 Tax=Lactococcus hircilactis TaxID=1494462 RepID=A0A7X2D1G7_9LACT|nr:DUF4352 domain-containing protein [Lactococcus hircilactis]MQW40553.1 DUF4352 domain-containing protein [Lactococcus hircilactis]
MKDGKEVRVSYYKQIWFWIAIVCIIIALIGVIIGGSSQSKISEANKKISSIKKSASEGIEINKKFESYMRENVPDYSSYASDAFKAVIDGVTNSSTTDSSTTESSDSKSETLSFGQSSDFESKSGNSKIEVSIISASIDPNIELSDDAPSGSKALVVEISVKNIGDSAYDFNIQSFNAYGADGNVLNFDSNTYDNTMPDSVNVGQTVKVKAYFDATDNGPFSVTFADGTWK